MKKSDQAIAKLNLFHILEQGNLLCFLKKVNKIMKSILLYKVVSLFLSVALDLNNYSKEVAEPSKSVGLIMT